MTPQARIWLLVASVYGVLAVGFGAFGAHALRGRLSPEMMAVYRTGSDYHFYHCLALLAVAILATRVSGVWLNLAGTGFALGVLLFSGSLYLLATTGMRWLGPVTPLGGLILMAAWLALGAAALRLPAAS